MTKAVAIFCFFALVILPENSEGENFRGKRLKVTMELIEGQLVAQTIEARDPTKDPNSGLVHGYVDEMDLEAETLKIGAFTITWSKTTEFKKISPELLKPGINIKASGRLVGKNQINASRIKLGSSKLSPGQIQIIGAVAGQKVSAEGKTQVTILGISFFAPKGIKIKTAFLTRRPDDKRPADQLTVPVFGRPLSIGGEFGVTTRWREDFTLGRKRDDVLRLDQELQIELFYQLTEDISIFAGFNTFGEVELHAEDNKRKTESGVSRDLTWIFIDNLFESNFSLQIGRQDFVESREWWWDEDLDGIRLYYNTYNWYAQIGIAQELAVEKTLERQIDPEEDKVLRFIGQAGWNWTSGNRLEFFFLHQLDGSKTENLGVILDEEDEDESDADLTWLGLRAIGKTRRSSIGQFKYWVDTGMVWGRESFLDFSGVGETQSRVKSRLERDVMGWGLDTGLSWSLPVRLRPAFTLSYAWGSGESNEEAEKDHAFRQTGLQDNNNRYGGVDRFRYYGELFRPELANLQILTGAFGFSFFQNSSVEFLYHNYRQVKAAPFQRDIRIKASPSGTDKDIGNEFDVVIGLEEWKHVEIELVSGVFWAGDAFEKRSGKRVYNFSFKFNYNF